MHTYDNTQVSTYQACPRKYYYKFVLGLAKETDDISTMDLRFGQTFHTFLEKYFKKEEINLAEIWQDYQEPIGELTKTQQGGIFLCQEYHNTNQAIDSKFNILAIEERIDFPIANFMFTVKPDLAIEINENIYSVENKTTGNLSYDFFNRFKFNSQITCQSYALRHKYGQCSGVIVNAAEIRFLKRKSAQRAAGFNAKFDRDILNRTNDEIDQWQNNVLYWLNLIEASRKTNVWLMADGGNACNAYRGCMYKEICRSCNNQEIIDTMYVPVDDPFAYLKKEEGNSHD